LRLGGDIVYHGTFGSGLFQCLYQRAPAHWAMLPSTLEWHAAAAAAALAGLFWPPAWVAVAMMLGLSLLVAGLQAAQARLAPQHDGFKARCLIMALSYLQPLVRSWVRYRTRLTAYRPPKEHTALGGWRVECLPLWGRREVAYWTEGGYERTELLALVIAYLNENGWGKTIDSGWSDWDVEFYCHPWTVVQACTAQEDHGGGKRLIRVRFRLRPSGYLKVLGGTAALAPVAAAGLLAWPAASEATLLLGACLGICAVWLGVWWRGTRRASQAIAVFDAKAGDLGLIRCDPTPARAQPSPTGAVRPTPGLPADGLAGRQEDGGKAPPSVLDPTNGVGAARAWEAGEVS
jgi:hypothetical protein